MFMLLFYYMRFSMARFISIYFIYNQIMLVLMQNKNIKFPTRFHDDTFRYMTQNYNQLWNVYVLDALTKFFKQCLS